MAKLTIYIEKKDGLLQFGEDRKIEAHFNPNRLSFSKSANWSGQPAAQRDTPELQFTNSDPRTLSVEFLFDTYDRPGTKKADVRDTTNQVLSLTTVEGHGEKKHRPPVCRLVWDRAGVIFVGVVQSVEQTFTMFMDNGIPVRATVRCSFKEWRTNTEDQQRQAKESSDLVKARVSKRGDTLAAIAADEYRDPRLWRPIAIASGIEDPLNLVPGTELRVPVLRTGA